MTTFDGPDLATIAGDFTLGDKAAVSLRDAIIRGSIPAGQTLRLDQTAGFLGISRIPVRDALRQLSKEGFVHIEPYVGARVADLTMEEGIELCEISELLHTLALKHVFTMLTPELIDLAEGLFRKRSAAKDTETWLRYSREFNEVFYGPAKKPHIIKTIISITVLSLRYWHACLVVVPGGMFPRASFLDVLTACRRGDLDGAVAAIHELHIGAQETLRTALGEPAPALA